MSHNNIDFFLKLLKGVHQKGEGWQAKCPAHNETKGHSLSIDILNGKIVTKCFGQNCSYESVMKAVGLKPSDGFLNKARSPEKEDAITLRMLCEQKNFEAEFLKSLGVYEATNKYGHNVIFIPYEGGRMRIRKRMRDGEGKYEKRFTFDVLRDEKGEKLPKEQQPPIIPYTPKTLDSDYVVLVEGETDTWTLILHHFPVIGIPGSQMSSCLKKNHIKNFKRIYIYKEPGEGGENFAKGMISQLSKHSFSGETLIVSSLDPDKFKDPNEMHRFYSPEEFVDAFSSMLENAQKIESPEKEGKSYAIPYWLQGGKFNGYEAKQEFLKGKRETTIFANDNFHVYENGVWVQKDDKAYKAIISSFLGEYSKVSYINEILELASLDLFVEKVEFNREWDKINLKNGVFCLKQKKVLAHDKKYFFNYQIPTRYIPGKKIDRWNKFLDEIQFSESQKRRMQEWFGFSMTSHYEINRRVEKSLYLLGEGYNGKSVVLDTLSHMLGKENCVSVEPSQITTPFGAWPIFGKLANIGTDIKSVVSLEESFKKFVSGEAVTADRKHKEAVTFRPFAKQIFSANNWMPTRDRSEGFYRRFDVFQFKKKFEKHERDKNLKYYLQENEIEGILQWSIEGLIRLINNGYEFSESLEVDMSMDEFMSRNNHVKQFVIEHGMESEIAAKEFRASYSEWCKENGFRTLSMNVFGEELRKIGIEKTRKRYSGKRIYYYYPTQKYIDLEVIVDKKEEEEIQQVELSVLAYTKREVEEEATNETETDEHYQSEIEEPIIEEKEAANEIENEFADVKSWEDAERKKKQHKKIQDELIKKNPPEKIERFDDPRWWDEFGGEFEKNHYEED